MPNQQNQRCVLITGGAKGIGEGMVRAFARAGYKVAFSYFQSEQAALQLCAALEQQGYEILAACCDVRESAQVDELFNRVQARFGRVDVLINNAGVSRTLLFNEMTDEQWHDIFAANMDGAFYCCRRAMKTMLHEHEGVILNISSMWGQVGASCEVAYSASKAALIGFTKALAKELGPLGIRVNCIAPGVIDTDMNRMHSPRTLMQLAQETPLCRLGTVQQVADTALFLAGDGASFITGQILGVNGGFVI